MKELYQFIDSSIYAMYYNLFGHFTIQYDMICMCISILTRIKTNFNSVDNSLFAVTYLLLQTYLMLHFYTKVGKPLIRAPNSLYRWSERPTLTHKSVWAKSLVVFAYSDSCLYWQEGWLQSPILLNHFSCVDTVACSRHDVLTYRMNVCILKQSRNPHK